MNFTPIAKRSKSEQRKYYASKRGSWNGLSPVTSCRAEQEEL